MNYQYTQLCWVISDDYMMITWSYIHMNACKAGEIWIKLVNCIDISSLVVILYCIYTGSSPWWKLGERYRGIFPCYFLLLHMNLELSQREKFKKFQWLTFFFLHHRYSWSLLNISSLRNVWWSYFMEYRFSKLYCSKKDTGS